MQTQQQAAVPPHWARLKSGIFLFFGRIKIENHFSLIAAAVTFIMWRSVGEDKMKKMEGKQADVGVDNKKRRGYWRVDCQSASKGWCPRK